MNIGFIGGRPGYTLLRGLGRDAAAEKGYCSGAGYAGRSKLEALFGPGIWGEVRDRKVLDFGCGGGLESVELAQRGARRVVGLDIRRKVLDYATRMASESGVSDRCSFTTQTDEKFDAVFSIDGFEHYDDPALVLRLLWGLLRSGGKVFIAFGPPWFHPMGGHLFSVFPWAHLLFTERALIRWRSDFKSDGATRFREVEGGLNQMTLGHFRELIAASPFTLQALEYVPIRRLRYLSNPLTREFLTSVVRCTLIRTE